MHSCKTVRISASHWAGETAVGLRELGTARTGAYFSTAPFVAAFAGRAYGGIYILTSLVWLWLVEGHRPDRPDFGAS
ncbi:MAG: hypothetical protein Q7R40_09970 [Phaeospirillum sp.]|nr:hypothetical protein [Phaeospirillum sp.]